MNTAVLPDSANQNDVNALNEAEIDAFIEEIMSGPDALYDLWDVATAVIDRFGHLDHYPTNHGRYYTIHFFWSYTAKKMGISWE